MAMNFHDIFPSIGTGGGHIHSQDFVDDFATMGMVNMTVIKTMSDKGAGGAFRAKETF